MSRKSKSSSRRRASFIALSLLIGVTSTLMILILAEMVSRYVQLPPRSYVPPKFSNRVLENISKNIAHLPTHIPVHLPPRLAHPKSYPNLPKPPFELIYPKNFFTPDPEIGTWTHPSSVSHVIQKGLDGRIYFDATYSIDQYRRRITPGQETGTRSQPLFFLGCSFTFGEGLQDDETIGAQVVKFQKNYKVYNYAFTGWGPGNVLRLIHSKDFAEDVPKNSGGKAVYIMIDHHIHRTIGSLDVYRANPYWPQGLPYYYLDSKGELTTKGMLADRPYINSLYSFLAQSKLLTWLSFELPPSIQEEHLHLLAAIFTEMRDTLRDRVNGMQLYIAFYPGSLLSKALIPLLDAQGIPSLDYSEYNLEQYIPENPRLPDFHPSAAAARFLAHQLVTDLGLH